MNKRHVERYAQAVRLFNTATGYTPTEMYEATEYPEPSHVAGRVTAFTASQLPEGMPHEDAKTLLYHALENVGDVIHFDLKLQPSPEAARKYILHEHTILALGRIAKLGNEEGSDQVHSVLKSLHTAQQQAYERPGYRPAPYLVLPHDLPSPPEGRGCPAVSHSGVEHSRLFEKVSVWAELLSLRALAHHGLTRHFSLSDTDESLFAMPEIRR